MIDYDNTKRFIYEILSKSHVGKVLIERIETNKHGTTYRHKHWCNPNEVDDKIKQGYKVVGGFKNLPKKQTKSKQEQSKLHKFVQESSFEGDSEERISQSLGYDGIQQAVYSLINDDGKKEFQIITLKDDDAEIKTLTPKEMSELLYKNGVKESEFEEDDLKAEKPRVQLTGNKDITSISNIGGKVLKSTKDAQEYFGMSESGDTRFSRFHNELSEKQQDCFRGYTIAEDRFYMLNFFFRKTGNPDFRNLRPHGYYEDDFKAFKMISKNMDAAISKFELDEPIKVYRLVSSYGVNEFINDIKKAHKNKTTFTDLAYASTSVVDGSVIIGGLKDGFKFEIVVPAGKGYGAWIAPYSPERYTEQNEFLLARGTKFKVLTDMDKIDIKSPGIKTIKLQVVENEQEPVENFENYFRRNNYVALKEEEKQFMRNGLGFSLKEAINEN